MRKIIYCLVAAMLVSTLLAGACAAPPPEEEGPAPPPEEEGPVPPPEEEGPAPPLEYRSIRIGGGGVGGFFYPLACGYMKIVNKYVPGFSATGEATGGSMENIRLIGTGKMFMGMAAAAWLKDAYEGTGKFEKAYPIRVMFWMPESYRYLFTLNPEYTSVQDVRGKRLAVGDIGSATVAATFTFLEAVGIGEKDFKPIYLGESAATEALRDGDVDFIMDMGSQREANIIELDLLEKINFIPLTDEEIELMCKAKKGYWKSYIRAENYRGLEEDVPTIATGNVVLCNAYEDDDAIYKVTKAIWEHLDVLAEVHAMGKEFDIELNKKEHEVVPMHPGAIRYFKEVGVR